jgi:tetratricopeptide (TPR) repeat protein
MTVAELPEGYKAISEEDQQKANVFFDRGKSVADGGQFEYAIEMYLQGLRIDPENTDAHQAMREISLKRKASGGKDLGFFEKMKLKKSGADETENLLNAEKVLAYDPGNTDAMLALLRAALNGGYFDTVLWIGPILQKANADAKSPDFSKFMILKDAYKALEQWKLAVDACQYAAMLKPDDMDLSTELKNLGAQHTMTQGKYGSARSFRDSVRDMDKQRGLLDADKDVRSLDVLQRQIALAETEWKAEPNEPGKLSKYVDALLRTELPEYENRAVAVLEEAYERTGQFRFRYNIGKIRMNQLTREERELRRQLQQNPADEEIKQKYQEFARRRWETELEEYKLASENYPTDMALKYQMATRLYQLKRYDDAIPVFQQARQNPQFRIDASVWLGRAFLDAGYVDESIDTLRGVIDSYELKGDAKSREMYYWFGRATEQKGDHQTALKAYSQVFQWDSQYRDVVVRIKRLRGG